MVSIQADIQHRTATAHINHRQVLTHFTWLIANVRCTARTQLSSGSIAPTCHGAVVQNRTDVVPTSCDFHHTSTHINRWKAGCLTCTDAARSALSQLAFGPGAPAFQRHVFQQCAGSRVTYGHLHHFLTEIHGRQSITHLTRHVADSVPPTLDGSIVKNGTGL